MSRELDEQQISGSGCKNPTPTRDLPLFLLLRTYKDKEVHFEFERKKGNLERKTGQQHADEWLKMATDIQVVISKIELAELKKKQASKHIAPSTTDKELSTVTDAFGYHISVLYLTCNPPTTAGYTHLDKIVGESLCENISHPYILPNQHSSYYTLASCRAF